ncbi:hypothetical protein psyc5s11_27490 [Clostridium gelidum]|uniref:Glycosyltransferase 2-like domain-containing protein n=1 Tax=Clostridium gelidum TaxID=704125 RepID=A0ABM7T4V6_9CLOT|nr:glycosyltransferase family 2 protein [Clostridium gelidum]BCZ46682.1 hypothetical protein psyc5s11_27490 [Clostridium gelidum]
MEFKINMSSVYKLLNSFMTDNFSYDYRINNFKINENLKNDYKEALKNKEDEYLSYLKENLIICSVKDVSINFLTLRDEIIELEYSFMLDTQNEKTDSQKYNCRLKLNPVNDGYEINNILLLNDEGVIFYGFHLIDLLKNRIRIAKPAGNTITLAVSVRNEADRFLKGMLTHAMQYVSNIVILDDDSTDNTVEVCEEILKNFPHKIYKNDEPMIMNLKESENKKKLWDLTIKENPDWILLLDADELFEDWGISVLPQIINDVNFDAYYFKIYHMWEDDEHYRVDGLWKPVDFRIYLLRYQPNYEYEWYNMELHSYRHPYNVYNMPGCYCYARLRHYGHFTKEIRNAKYEKYKLLDPNAIYVPKSHYDSILEENPILEKF